MRQIPIGNMSIGSYFAIHDGSISGRLIGLNTCEATVRITNRGEALTKNIGISLATMVVPLAELPHIGTPAAGTPIEVQTTTTPMPVPVPVPQTQLQVAGAYYCACGKKCTSTSGLTLHKARCTQVAS